MAAARTAREARERWQRDDFLGRKLIAVADAQVENRYTSSDYSGVLSRLFAEAPLHLVVSGEHQGLQAQGVAKEVRNCGSGKINSEPQRPKRFS